MIMTELFSRVNYSAGRGLIIHDLCVPSMGTVLKGFKSPVYETMNRKTPAEANCGRATDRGKEGYAKAAIR